MTMMLTTSDVDTFFNDHNHVRKRTKTGERPLSIWIKATERYKYALFEQIRVPEETAAIGRIVRRRKDAVRG